MHYSCASDSLEGAGEQLRRSVDEDRAYNPVHFPWRTIKIEAQTNLWHGALAWVAELYALDEDDDGDDNNDDDDDGGTRGVELSCSCH